MLPLPPILQSRLLPLSCMTSMLPEPDMHAFQKSYLHEVMVLIAFILSVFFTTAEPTSLLRWTNGLEHDFGTMPQGRPRAYTFHYTNTSAEPITIETVRTTCGCTAARWTETPVEPDAVGEVTLEYDAYKQGAFTKKVKVFFYQQKKAEVLTIFGEVE